MPEPPSGGDVQKTPAVMIVRKRWRLLPAVREALAIAVWTYIPLKLFVYDVDILLVTKLSPSLVALLRYRFFILAGVVAAAWVLTGKWNVPKWIGYIAIYPAVLLFWRIPVLIFRRRSWVLAIAVLNSVISFFRSARMNSVVTALFLVSGVGVLVTSSKLLLLPAATIISVILLMTYALMFARAYRTPGVFRALSAFLPDFRRKTTTFVLDEKLRDLPVADLDSAQLAKWSENLQMSVLYNRCCLFMARKIRDYRNSGFVYASPVSTFLLLLLLTVAAFTLLNLAFYKLAPHSFSAAATPTLFTFFYYSFTHLGFSTIADLAPASPFTQTVAMAQSLLALLLGTVFVTMLFSVRNQKRMEELDDTIRCLEAESAEMEGYIRMEYKFNSVEEAMAELERLKTFLAKFLLKVTDNTV